MSDQTIVTFTVTIDHDRLAADLGVPLDEVPEQIKDWTENIAIDIAGDGMPDPTITIAPTSVVEAPADRLGVGPVTFSTPEDLAGQLDTLPRGSLIEVTYGDDDDMTGVFFGLDENAEEPGTATVTGWSDHAGTVFDVETVAEYDDETVATRCIVRYIPEGSAL